MSFASEESYAEELGEFREAGINAGVVPEILRMINNFSTPNVHLNGSALLNAHSNGCSMLAENPSVALAEKPVEGYLPDSKLGYYLLNLVNDSVKRDSEAKPAFTTNVCIRPHLVCTETEPNMVRAMGDREGIVTSDPGKVSKIYCMESGEPVLFKKGVGVSSSIALREISLNGITYPAGMLFGVHQKKRTVGTNMPPHQLEVNVIGSISSIAPLRLSEFALPKEEQSPAFIPDDERFVMGEEEAALKTLGSMQMTVEELAIHLPNNEELLEVITR